MKVYDFRVPNTHCTIWNRNPGHLADDKLSFRLIEIVCGDFEVKLERNEE